MLDVTIQGALLGLSTGLFCLGYCVPVFVPLMMSEKRKVKQSAWVIGELALGRLVAYLIVGAAVGYIGMQLESPFFQKVVGGIMIILSGLMLLFVATRMKPHLGFCRWANNRYIRFPILFGFFTGFYVCPPFLLAISYTLGLGGISKGVLFFGGFFLGTSVYLLMLLPLGFLGKWENFRLIALLTAVFSGVFFLGIGIIRLLVL